MDTAPAATPAPAGPASASEAPKRRRLPPQHDRFKQTVQANTSYTVVAETGTVLAEVLDPGYWVHFAAKLIPGDEIIVFVDDWSWEARLRVRSKGPLGAGVAVLSHHKYEVAEMPAELADQFKVEWKGPAWQYCVFRVGETEPLAKGYRTAEEANRWLVENTRSLQKQKPKAA